MLDKNNAWESLGNLSATVNNVVDIILGDSSIPVQIDIANYRKRNTKGIYNIILPADKYIAWNSATAACLSVINALPTESLFVYNKGLIQNTGFLGTPIAIAITPANLPICKLINTGTIVGIVTGFNVS